MVILLPLSTPNGDFSDARLVIREMILYQQKVWLVSLTMLSLLTIVSLILLVLVVTLTIKFLLQQHRHHQVGLQHVLTGGYRNVAYNLSDEEEDEDEDDDDDDEEEDEFDVMTVTKKKKRKIKNNARLFSYK